MTRKVLIVRLWAAMGFAFLLPAIVQAADETVSAAGVEVPTAAIFPLALAVVSAIAALLTALIPADKMPRWLRAVLDLLGSNWGNAKNAPPAAPAAPSAPRPSVPTR